jgi:hypothetical protein
VPEITLVPGVTSVTSARFGTCEESGVKQQGHAMNHFRKAIIATRIAFLLVMPFATPAAAASFDGSWNVRIASNNSECGNGATVSIGISNGQVSGDGMVHASGRVADAGSISVTLVSGIKRATGFGHLTSTSGSGTWHGALCSGTWTAQRI